jgi:hypothetical protein
LLVEIESIYDGAMHFKPRLALMAIMVSVVAGAGVADCSPAEMLKGQMVGVLEGDDAKS